MADSIFRHEDRDGEELDVYRVDGEALVFHATEHASHFLTSVHLGVVDVLRLRDALTDWIGDRDITYPVKTTGLTASDVEAIVSRMLLTDVKPLQQSPQASLPAPLCTRPGCTLFPGTPEHFEHGPTAYQDPEPRDVGHPDPVDVALADPSPSWSDKLFAPLVTWKTNAPRQLVGCECGHRWGVHGGQFGCNTVGCECTRKTQADANNASARCGECNRILRFGHMHGCSQRVQP